MILHCDLTLKTAKKSFWKTIWLLMMNHQTKFGCNRFSDLEGIIWTNIDFLTIRYALP